RSPTWRRSQYATLMHVLGLTRVSARSATRGAARLGECRSENVMQRILKRPGIRWIGGDRSQLYGSGVRRIGHPWPWVENNGVPHNPTVVGPSKRVAICMHLVDVFLPRAQFHSGIALITL